MRNTHELRRADMKMMDRGEGFIYSELGNDPEFATLVEMFVDELPSRASALRAAFDKGDREQVRRLAHQMKGAAGSYGFSSITLTAAMLEEEAAGGPDAEIAARLEELLRILRVARSGCPGPAENSPLVERVMFDSKSRVLVVDDDPAIRQLLRASLEPRYEIAEAVDGAQAIELLGRWRPDLVLLDIMMEGINGYEVCREIKARQHEVPPQVIVVSAKSKRAEQVLAFDVGADDYLEKPFDVATLLARVEIHFRLRRSQFETRQLEEQVNAHHRELREVARDRSEQVSALQDLAVFTLAKVAESRDQETGNHMTRLREYTQRLAHDLAKYGPYVDQIDEQFLADLYHSSPLHDIGKVGISDAILLKPGPLTADEFESMKMHTVIGANILNEAVGQTRSGGFLRMASVIAQFHHERWDGKGYPGGLAGTQIPLPARIVSVADVFDALTSERPYKKAWTNEDARAEILAGAGTQFDPSLVAAFERCYDGFLEVREQHSDFRTLVVGAMGFVSEAASPLSQLATTV